MGIGGWRTRSVFDRKCEDEDDGEDLDHGAAAILSFTDGVSRSE
jgi:hypothetical protein